MKNKIILKIQNNDNNIIDKFVCEDFIPHLLDINKCNYPELNENTKRTYMCSDLRNKTRCMVSLPAMIPEVK